MPDDQTPSPAADAPASPPAPPAAQPASGGIPREWLTAFSDPSEDTPAASTESPPAVSNEPAGTPAPAAAAAKDAEPAPDTGVSASAAPEPGDGSDTPEKALSRRQREAAEKDAEIERLAARVSEYETPEYRQKLRDEILAEEAARAASNQTAEQARANAERFEQAIRMSTNDPRLYENVPGTNLTLAEWRDEQIELRDRYPEARTAIMADAQRYVDEATAAADKAIADGWTNIQADISRQIDASTKLPHVDASAFAKSGVTWADMAEQIHAAGAAWKEAELSTRVSKAEADAAQLRKDNEDLRAELARDKRAPAVVGRSAGAAPNGDVFDPSLGWRGNLVGSLSPNGHG